MISYGNIDLGQNWQWPAAWWQQAITWTNFYLLVKLWGKVVYLKLLPHFSNNSLWHSNPDSKVHGANMGPTWVLSSPGGPHVGPMKIAIRECHVVFSISANSRLDTGLWCRTTTGHYLNQWWLIIIWLLRNINIFQWNFIQVNTSENACKMAAILFRSHCIKCNFNHTMKMSCMS